MSRFSPLGFGLFLFAMMAIGCGGSEFAPVSGAVTYKGEPLSGATVTFSPVEGKKFSYAVTDANGGYELVVAGMPNQSGAKIGEHRVKVTAIAETPRKQQSNPVLASVSAPGSSPKISYLIPPKYDNYETSGLTFTVTGSGSTQADFALAE